MRLLVVNVFAGPAHRQQIWYRLADLTGWDIHLAVGLRWVDDYGNVVDAQSSSHPRVTIHPFRIGLAGNIPLHYWRDRVAQLARTLAPDLAYVYSEPYSLSTIQIARFLPEGLPFGFHSAQNIVKKYPLPFRLGQTYVLRKAAYATSVSGEVADGLRTKGFPGPIGRHTFGLSAGWFMGLQTPPSGEGLRCAYVGRLSAEKGLKTLFTALAAVSDTVAEVRIFGEGVDRGTYEDMVTGSAALRGKVRFEGFLEPENVKAAYDWADVLAVPSETTPAWKEQFGRVVIEAGARGCHPIVSSSGELPRLVGRLQFGDVAPERDAPAWARALSSASQRVEELRSTRPARSQRVQKLFSEDAVAGELAEFFASIVGY